MPNFKGHRVSRDWHDVLTYVENELKTPVPLNSGQRTIPEQQRLYDCWVRRCQGPRTPVAAKPSCGAPHIDCGQQSHALDIACDDADRRSRSGQHWRVVRELQAIGLDVHHTVSSECWHIEVPEAQLKLTADRIRRIRGERERYGRVRTAILKRSRNKLASPGQRRLLGSIRKRVARLRKVLS